MREPSVLFARSDSCYFDLVADVWDIKRDALRFSGPGPVVAHPPCRGWGRLSHVALPRPGELDCGPFAVQCVRRFGGVLEHPHASKLWRHCSLPRPGFVDSFGGFTLLVDQGWWGHPAPKPTWLYVVGISRRDVGDLPVTISRASGRVMSLPVHVREATPLPFARFLVSLASRCYVEPGRVGYTEPGRVGYADLVAMGAVA